VKRRYSKWALLLTGAGAFLAGTALHPLATAAAAPESPYDLVRQLARVLVLVENEYVDPVERSRLLEGAIKGMVAELDPHSSYLPAEDYKTFQEDTQGEFPGIGVEVDFRNETVVVIAVIEGSPAEHAGIRAGDRIVAIDGSPVRGKASPDLIRAMRGPPGTRVIVSLNRDTDDKLLHFNLIRAVIRITSVVSSVLEGNFAYVRIRQFQSGTHAELLGAIGKLRRAAGGDFPGVILDLRNNPGGLVDEASAIADEFLVQGVIYTTRHRGVTVDEVRAGSGGAMTREPMVVLVNEFSASAAELLAGALQDQRRASVVGATTFGKGSVQSIVDLPGDAGLRLTTMRYHTPNGRAIQAQGIEPDVRVADGSGTKRPFGVLRESDLENHLPAEGPASAGSRDRTGPEVEIPKSTDSNPPSEIGGPREVPKNPLLARAKDPALATAYEMLVRAAHH
jgi:carboxyl-terminal processing protease